MITKGMLTSIAAAMAMLIGSSASGQLSKDDQKCIDGYNNKLRLVSQQAGKDYRSCVKNAGKGAEPSPGTCITSDTPGKIAGKVAKVTELFNAGGKCDPVPAVIVQGAGPGSTAHIDGVQDLFADIFGPTAATTVSPGKDEAKCQDKAGQRSGQALTQIIKSHRKCKKNAMKANAVVDEGSLQSTCGSFAQIDADGKASSKLAKLSGDVAAACAAPVTPISIMFPGTCSASGTPAVLGGCLVTASKCRACEIINAADGTGQNCDLFDDGAANASCSSPAPCPLAAGAYTITQVAGGSLTVNGFAAFPFPAGGSILQDVGAGVSPACVHSTVVPFPGGFTAPNFCIPALGFVTSITQTACGVGRIDSNGGSDFTVNEIGDTSDASATCSLPHAGCTNGGDSSQRVDITVGNGAADTCPGGGTANAIVAIPVFTKTWLDTSGGPQVLPPCNGDGVNQVTDLLITQFPQILDFTTDVTSAKWMDIDSDGCFLAGAGPAAGFTDNGTCLNIGAGTIETAAAGTIGSSGAPTFDLSFLSVLPNNVTGPAAPLGATCAVPPVINFSGSTTRCIP